MANKKGTFKFYVLHKNAKGKDYYAYVKTGVGGDPLAGWQSEWKVFKEVKSPQEASKIILEMRSKQSPQPTKMDMTEKPLTTKVIVGYHTITLQAGQSVKVDKQGNISIIGKRGKITNTKLNTNTVVPHFSGIPLRGDVKNRNLIEADAYHGDSPTPPSEVKKIFQDWKIITSFGGYKFKSLNKTMGSLRLYYIDIAEFDCRCVASSEHPTSLVYILHRGVEYFPQKGINKDIPLTSGYVKDVERTARSERIVETVNLTLPGEDTSYEVETIAHLRITKKAWKHLKHAERQVAEDMLKIDIREAREAMSKRVDKPSISNKQALVAMGVIPDRGQYKEEYDAPRPKLTKKQLADLKHKFFEAHHLDVNTISTKRLDELNIEA
jgi:hypothetical protein